MLRYGKQAAAAVSLALLCGTLLSCASGSRESAPSETQSFPATEASSAAPSESVSSDEPANVLPERVALPASEEPAASPSETERPASGVGISKAEAPETETGEEARTKELPFEPGGPVALCGIELGMGEGDVKELLGLPEDAYELPGDGEQIEIWDYFGLSVGFDSSGLAVYAEVTSDDVSTGIQGLSTGMPGSEAARLLSVPDNPDSQVLAAQLANGWLKLDLDPSTQQVLSIKMISVLS